MGRVPPTEDGHVGRIQAVSDGGTVSLFWSRRDTSRRLLVRTSTDLVNWTARTPTGLQVGAESKNTTSAFALARTATGQWLAGWLYPGAVTEGHPEVAWNTSYPVVRVARSTDLATWSGEVELTLPWSQPGARSVALGRDAGGSGTLRALFERAQAPQDSDIVQRTSADGGQTWATESVVGYDRSAARDGNQGYHAALPAVAVGGSVCGWSAEVSGSALLPYGRGDQSNADAGKGLTWTDCAGAAEPWPMPYGAMSPMPSGFGVDPITGWFGVGGLDVSASARSFNLLVARSYNSADGVAGNAGPFGNGWAWAFGAHAVTHLDGSVTIVETGGGRSAFWKNGSTWEPAPGVNALLQPSGGGYSVTRRNKTVWVFDAQGRLASITDRNSSILTISYNGSSLAPSVMTAPGGRTLTFTLGANGRVMRVDGPAGSALVATYSYDAAGNLLSAADAAGMTTSYAYDSRRQLLQITVAGSAVPVSNTYGTLARVVSAQTGGTINPRTGVPGGWLAAHSYTYAKQGYAGSYGNASIHTDGIGVQWWTYNDAMQRVIQREAWQPGPRVGLQLLERRIGAYDAYGNTTSATGPDGRVTNLTYPAPGGDVTARSNALSVTVDAGVGGLNLVATATYTAFNDLATRTDPLGHTTTFSYNATGNRTAERDPLGHGPNYTYDAYGQLVSESDATNNTTTYAYNAFGDLTSSTDPANNAWNWSYDAAGRPTTTTDPLGHVTSSTYDGMGRRTQRIVDAGSRNLNITTTYQYDGAGNHIRTTDPLGRQTAYEYDALSHLTAVIDASGGRTAYGYSAAGRWVSTTDALGRTATFSYDGLGRRTARTDALGFSTSYTYDAAGNLSRVTKPDGIVNALAYDRLNRLVAIDLQNNATADVTYTYDNAGRRTAMTDSTGTTSYVYDNANRLLSTAAPYTGTVGYAYDNAGRLLTLTYPVTNHQVQYAYNSRGKLASITDWNAKVASYTYDGAGQRVTAALPNGQPPSTYSYDDAGRLLSVTHSYAGSRGPSTFGLSYTYDAAGNQLSVTDTTAGGTGVTTYAFDALDRLTGATYPNGDTESFTYDAVGNRTSVTQNGVVSTATYDRANRILTSGTATFTFDANGNQTSQIAGGVSTSYTYDARDQLGALIRSSTTAGYTYNQARSRSPPAGRLRFGPVRPPATPTTATACGWLRRSTARRCGTRGRRFPACPRS